MGILFKIILTLVVIALIALVGFSYYPGSLAPPQQEVTHPVTLDVQ